LGLGLRVRANRRNRGGRLWCCLLDNHLLDLRVLLSWRGRWGSGGSYKRSSLLLLLHVQGLEVMVCENDLESGSSNPVRVSRVGPFVGGGEQRGCESREHDAMDGGRKKNRVWAGVLGALNRFFGRKGRRGSEGWARDSWREGRTCACTGRLLRAR
jgi:hypothetical protein